jgi:hypothetical protein
MAEIFEVFADDEWPDELGQIGAEAVYKLRARISNSGYVQIITGEELDLHLSPERRSIW